MTPETDSAYKTADEIEREVDAARRRVADTIESIEDKLSPGQIVDRFLPLFRESGASATMAHYGKALGRSARDNPVPFLLIGAGIAWMAMSSGGGRETYRTTAYDAGYGGDREDGAGEESGGRLSHLGERMREGIHDARDTVRERVHGMTERARESGHHAMDSARHMAGRGREMAAQHPLLLALAGLTVGAALGAAMPASRLENRLAGEYGAKLKRAAWDGMEKVEEAASAAVDAAREAASEEGLTLEAGKDSARDLAEKVEHVGEAALQAARERLTGDGSAGDGGSESAGGAPGPSADKPRSA
jgi:ElaB/YqjD/DUF883 family membrane-anchored ribosome-binding protein